MLHILQATRRSSSDSMFLTWAPWHMLVSIFTCLLFYSINSITALHAQQAPVFNEVMVNPGAGTDAEATQNNNLLTSCSPGFLYSRAAKEWIELYNPDLCNAIDLSCWILATNMGEGPDCRRLGDKPDNTFVFVFPNGTRMQPGGFLTIGGKDITAFNPNLRFDGAQFTQPNFCPSARFWLRDNGGWLALFRPDGNVADAVYWTQNAADATNQNYLDGRTGVDYFRKDISHNCGCTTIPTLPSAAKLYTDTKITYAGATNVTDDQKERILLRRRFDGSKNWEVVNTEGTPNAANGIPITVPIINVTPKNTSFCAGNTVTLGAVATQPNPEEPVTITWQEEGGTFTANGNSITVSPTRTTRYTATASQKGCSGTGSSETATVTITPAPFTADFSFGSDMLCPNEPVTVTYNGTAPTTATFTWSLDGATPPAVLDRGPFDLSWQTTGTKTVRLKIEDLNKCATESAKTIVVTPRAKPGYAVNRKLVCINEPVEVKFSGVASDIERFNWDLDGGTSQSTDLNSAGPHLISWATPGEKSIRLIVSYNSYCNAETTFTVNVIDKPIANFTITPQVCIAQGAELTFTADTVPGANYVWDFAGGGALPGIGKGPHKVQWLTAGLKRVTVRVDAGGSCQSEVFDKTVTVIPPPEVKALIDSTEGSAPFTTRFTVTSTNYRSVLWDFGDNKNETVPEIEKTFLAPGTYTVKLTIIDNNGCINTAEYSIKVNNPLGELIFPDAFSPGNDPIGRNDRFTIRGLDLLQTFTFAIYNRAGQKLFTSTEKERFDREKVYWNGDFNGREAPEGVYIYNLEGRKYNGDVVRYTGTITLIR